jgi:hypothetical protein
MSPETFDNSAEETTDEDYFAFVDWLSETTAAKFRTVKGEYAQEKQILCWYYRRGECANLTVSELIDFLAVNASSILERAGYNEEETMALMEISDKLTEEEIHAPL